MLDLKYHALLFVDKKRLVSDNATYLHGQETDWGDHDSILPCSGRVSSTSDTTVYYI